MSVLHRQSATSQILVASKASDACAAHVQSKPISLPTQATSASPADEPPLPSMRLAPLFQQATDQPTPPSPLHHHELKAEPAAARRTHAGLAGRPLPRLMARDTLGTAVDPALHELRVASLDRGLLWNGATPTTGAAAAHSAPSALMRPEPAAFAGAPPSSSHQTADTGERIMQGLRAKAELQRQRMASAAAAVQLAGKLAVAASVALASHLSSPEHVDPVVTTAVAAATFAASATVAAAFSLPSSSSIDTSAANRNGSNTVDKNDIKEDPTCDTLSRVIEQPPVRGPEHMSQAGLLFSALQPGEQSAFGAAGMQLVSPTPNPGTSAPQPDTASSIPHRPSEVGHDASPAASIVSDKENVSPAKPSVHAPALAEVPASLHPGQSGHVVPGATGRAALASRPTLPPRGARRGPQQAVPAWQVSAPFPACSR